VSWRYLTMRPQVLFNPSDPEYVRVAYADEQAMMQNMVTDPSLGLFSGTNSSKGTVIFQKFTEGVAGIVAGRDPLSLLDQLIRDWRAAGGDQIRGEFEQTYAEAMR
jgi:putative aldouronate transport system substrate-binding protein